MGIIFRSEDEGIISLFQNRDETAIIKIQKKYGGFIFSVCNAILRVKEDSEECVNTVLEILWNSIPPENPQNLRAYIATVARTTAIDCLRKGVRQKRNGVSETLEDYSDIISDNTSVTDEVLAHELTKILNGFLETLSEKERVCFVWRYYFCRSVEEISKKTAIPRSSVYMILDRAKVKLKELLIKEGYLQ